ncbi:MAG: glutathione synthase [Myxococcales bacterium]|nr:glutathione synthase [Myxococcales bacterium]
MAQLDFAFVMDPMEKVHPDKDTTFVLMLESLARGHACWHVVANRLQLRSGKAYARGRRVTVQRGDPAFTYHEWRDFAFEEMDAVWIRTDPPFDMAYYEATLILDRAKDDTVILNDPTGVRGANEKLYALNFPDVVPRSIVACDPEPILAFIEEIGGDAVLKPIDMMGGFGIFRARLGDENLPSLIDYMTLERKRRIFVQQFIPRVYEGDKRIILCNGEPLGAVLRVPREGDFRGNIHVGGRVRKTDLDDDDKRIIETVAPRLRADGLYLVGIDVVGGCLTEVNVTSPTGVQEINRLNGSRIEGDLIDFAEGLVAQRKAGAAR